MSGENERRAPPRRAAELLELSDSPDELWSPGELGAILQHQLAVPLQFDLAAISPQRSARIRAVADSRGLLVKSLGDLLGHPHPPLALLQLVKRFAKANAVHPHTLLPPDVARVIYFLAIAAAMTRCSRRITSLDDDSLKAGLEWSARQDWTDENLRRLLADAIELLPR